MPMPRLINSLQTRTDHCETQCDAWAALLLSQNLITFTGDSEYGNWIERLAYNAINVTIPMSPTGNVMYYSNYNMNGAMKLNRPIEWTCCAGTRPLTVIQYHLNTYFYDEDNIYVNLFTPSKVEWDHSERVVELIQDTEFPFSEEVNISISVERSDRFGIGIRIPEWLSSPMTARVNNREVEGRMTEKNWYVINRRWKDGDKLTITVPMDFWLNGLDKCQNRPTAVMYGPMSMVFTTPNKTLSDSIDTEWWTYEGRLKTNPDGILLDKIELKKIKDQFKQVGDDLEFEYKGNSDLKLKTFMNCAEGELYYMYLNR